MNQTEKQNYIRLQAIKLQRLSEIVNAINNLIYNTSVNVRTISDYSDKNSELDVSSTYLFTAINEYKTLLSDFGEL